MHLDPKQSIVNTLTIYEDCLYVGMGDYRIIIWDLKEYKLIKEITDDLWEMRSISVDAKNIYAASLNEYIIVIDRLEFDQITQLSHELGVLTTHCSDRFLYSGSYGPMVKVWDKTTFALISNLPNHFVRVNAIHESNGFIYTGDGFTIPNSTLRVWKIENFTLQSEIKLDCLRTLDITSDDRNIYSSHGGKASIRIWNKTDMNELLKIELKRDINSLAVNERLLVATSKDKLLIYDKKSLDLIHSKSENGREVNISILYKDKIIYGSRDKINIIDTINFELVKELKLV